MPKAVQLPSPSGIRKEQQLQFNGYAHTVSCSEGQIWDMENISGAAWPYLRPIRNRLTYNTACGNGLFAHDELGWIDGTELWYDGHLAGYVENSRKTVAVMGNRVVIWPDKVVLNVSYKRLGIYSSLSALKSAVSNPKEFDAYGVGSAVPYEIYVWNGTDWISNGKEVEPLENREKVSSVTFKSGTYKNVPADANTIELTVQASSLGFKEGDGVTISGCTKHPENNKTAIIREIDGKQLRFYENAFKLDGSEGLTAYKEPGTITFSRTVPDMDVICAVNNRLWGAKDDTIYASKLGDPTNFNVFDGLTSDSWFQSTGTAGEFTGCIAYLGYPMFFKENLIFKIYGANAENFQFSQSATMGVKRGANRSLAIAGEVLYYLSPNGLVAYTGGIPESVAAPFGEVKYRTAVNGSDGRRLYASMERVDGTKELFCLDTETGLLTKEDDLNVWSWCCHHGVLYGLQESGQTMIVNDDTAANCPDSMVEFGDFYAQSMNRKGVSKLQMRVVIPEGSELAIYIQYDSDGVWRPVRRLTNTVKNSFEYPVRVKRCDHFRIKLEGVGYWELQAMAKEFYVGSGVH